MRRWPACQSRCELSRKPLVPFAPKLPPLQINVFTLGAVFLQLAKVLRVTEHPMFAK